MKKAAVLLLVIFHLVSCRLPSVDDLPIDQTFAIPIINDKIKIQDLLSSSDNLSILVDNNGAITLIYKSELLEQSINEILPAISSVGEIPIPDTTSQFTLSTGTNLMVNKAIFKGDEMRFRYTSNLTEDVRIQMRIPELTKDNVPFLHEYNYIYDPDQVTAFTEAIELNGYEFNSSTNRLSFNYDARNESGERIKLDFAAMSFNELQFAYGEGSFEREEYVLNAELLPINVYAAWKSGKLEFEDPKLNFTIEHSFGFPISIRINSVDLVLIDNVTKSLTGDNVENEINLEYPALNEVGQNAYTTLLFDKSNSNFNTLINEKVKTIYYKVDAIINPNNDLDFVGFVTDESYFKLTVEAELPLNQKIENLQLSDTFEINNIPDYEINSAEFKIVTANSYPASMSLELEFLDAQNDSLFSLSEYEELVVEAGKLQTDGTTLSSDEVIRFVDIPSQDLQKISSIRKVVISPLFDSSNLSEDFLGFFEDQYLELRMGLIFKI